jgi:hypothetical protein
MLLHEPSVYTVGEGGGDMGWREVMFKYMYSAHRDGRGEGSAGTFYYNALLLHTLYILPSYRYVCVPLTELG